jgi:hypothetical protein
VAYGARLYPYQRQHVKEGIGKEILVAISVMHLKLWTI